MKIFTDLHHADLYYSLHLLLEHRLKHELYHPIGMDWFTEGYWKIAEPYNNAIDTIKQFLDPDTHTEGYVYKIEDKVYYIKAINRTYIRKAITLEKFKSMDFDIIMPSYPSHDRVYEKLRNRFQPRAKIVMQVGNIGQKTSLRNVLHSSEFKDQSPKQNCLKYNQEIDSDLFCYSPPNTDTKNIYSVVNCAPCLNIYNKYKNIIKEASWKYYGGGCPDGILIGPAKVSEKMKEANIGWHLKPLGGLGHSAKCWFAVGRPTIIRMSQHQETSKEIFRLFEPGITCIDLDAGTVHENSKKIKQLLRPDINIKWAKRVRRRFKEVINYDEQEKQIRRFLENLR
jgi:hypothetical protein